MDSDLLEDVAISCFQSRCGGISFFRTGIVDGVRRMLRLTPALAYRKPGSCQNRWMRAPVAELRNCQNFSDFQDLRGAGTNFAGRLAATAPIFRTGS